MLKTFQAVGEKGGGSHETRRTAGRCGHGGWQATEWEWQGRWAGSGEASDSKGNAEQGTRVDPLEATARLRPFAIGLRSDAFLRHACGLLFHQGRQGSLSRGAHRINSHAVGASTPPRLQPRRCRGTPGMIRLHGGDSRASALASLRGLQPSRRHLLHSSPRAHPPLLRDESSHSSAALHRLDAYGLLLSIHGCRLRLRHRLLLFPARLPHSALLGGMSTRHLASVHTLNAHRRCLVRSCRLLGFLHGLGLSDRLLASRELQSRAASTMNRL